MVVNPSSPCTLFAASFNVLQSSGTRTEFAVDIAVVAVIDDGTDKDVFVSLGTTDADCTVHQQYTEQNESENGDQEQREGK